VDKNYGIANKKDGFLFHSENFNIPENAPYEELTKEICSSNETVSADKIIDTVINDNKLQGV